MWLCMYVCVYVCVFVNVYVCERETCVCVCVCTGESVCCMYVLVHTSKQSHLADSLPANYLLIKSKVTEGSVKCKDHNDAYIKMSLIIYICHFLSTHLKLNTVYFQLFPCLKLILLGLMTLILKLINK